MTDYHKIPTVWRRDPETNHKTLIRDAWATDAIDYLSCYAEWEWTEKVDGTNIRILWVNGSLYSPFELSFRGRTDRALLPPELISWLNDNVTDEKMHAALDGSFVLYGEGYGAGIQKGGVYLDHQEFVLFDVLSIPEAGDPIFLKQSDVLDIAEKLGLRSVPVLGHGDLRDAIGAVEHGELKSAWGDFEPEGLVMRPLVELRDRMGDRVICKIKAKDFPKA